MYAGFRVNYYSCHMLPRSGMFPQILLKIPHCIISRKFVTLSAEYFHAVRGSHMAYLMLAFAYCFVNAPEILTWPI